jgi:hypothetical protein
MLKPVSARFSSKTKGLIIRVATRSLWSVGWEDARVGARQISKSAISLTVNIALSNKVADRNVGKRAESPLRMTDSS